MDPIPEEKQSNVEMKINNNNNNNLTNDDIQSMINILQLCSQRGAFRVDEFKQISLFYERLNNLKKNITQ
tara:strand:+ start:1123 stop:1332 length:210 start_codon:yes stop_codon:yes gene_type:complete